jgi:hypothetical protein
MVGFSARSTWLSTVRCTMQRAAAISPVVEALGDEVGHLALAQAGEGVNDRLVPGHPGTLANEAAFRARAPHGAVGVVAGGRRSERNH